ncbi:MAG: FKBP-type peptidyl-prolyl cis-trans isomerase N-terminal domain-containing protein [Bdellovibrionales bacterium]
MKRQSWIIGVLLIIVAGAGIYILLHPKKWKDTKGQASYWIGYKFGQSLNGQKLDLDGPSVAAGLVDAYMGNPMQMTNEEMDKAMIKLGENQRAERQQVGDRNKAFSEKFLEENAQKEDVVVTKSGLQYKMIEEGEGKSPKANNKVAINFRFYPITEGSPPDGKFAPNQNVEINVSGVVPGWSEGLQLMKKGGKAIFWVPPQLGYGDHSMQNTPPWSVLVYEVELLDIH